MFCSCCEFGGSRSSLGAKASILDKEHCARFYCDSAWSNLKASVVTSDLSQMLTVLYCDFSGVRRLANGASAAERSSPRLLRRNPDPPQLQAAPAPAAGVNDVRPADEAPTPPIPEVAQGDARPAEGAAARQGKETKRRRG